MQEYKPPAAYRIGDFTLDLIHRRLLRGSQEVPCGKLTLKFLILLAERSPRVARRNHLIERVWQGRYVSPATIKRRAALLRQALGDRAATPKYLRVARGEGYALIPEVVSLSQLPSPLRLAMFASRWQRAGLTASALLAAFVLGAEVAHRMSAESSANGSGLVDLSQDPSISVVAASWPSLWSGDFGRSDDLSDENYQYLLDVSVGIVSELRERRSSGADFQIPGLSPELTRLPMSIVALAATDTDENSTVRFFIVHDLLTEELLNRIKNVMRVSNHLSRFAASDGSSEVAKVQFVMPMAARPRVRNNPVALGSPQGYLIIADHHYNLESAREEPESTALEVGERIAAAIYEKTQTLRIRDF